MQEKISITSLHYFSFSQITFRLIIISSEYLQTHTEYSASTDSQYFITQDSNLSPQAQHLDHHENHSIVMRKLLYSQLTSHSLNPVYTDFNTPEINRITQEQWHGKARAFNGCWWNVKLSPETPHESMVSFPPLLYNSSLLVYSYKQKLFLFYGTAPAKSQNHFDWKRF